MAVDIQGSTLHRVCSTEWPAEWLSFLPSEIFQFVFCVASDEADSWKSWVMCCIWFCYCFKRCVFVKQAGQWVVINFVKIGGGRSRVCRKIGERKIRTQGLEIYSAKVAEIDLRIFWQSWLTSGFTGGRHTAMITKPITTLDFADWVLNHEELWADQA